MCTGEYAKHPGAETFRILFVSEHNACRSQMAEAIALSLNQPRFVFSSAGIDPRAIAPQTIQFMKEKGLDTSRLAPKTIFQVPNLDHYQVIVGVAKEAQQAFPRSPRKTVYVDWSIDDPSRVQGSPEDSPSGLRGHLRVPLEPRARPRRSRPRHSPHSRRHGRPVMTRLRALLCPRMAARLAIVVSAGRVARLRRPARRRRRAHRDPEQGLGHDGQRRPGLGRGVPQGRAGRRGRGVRRRLGCRPGGAAAGRGRHRQRQPRHQAGRARAGAEQHRQGAQGTSRSATTPSPSTCTRTTRSSEITLEQLAAIYARGRQGHVAGPSSGSRSRVSATTRSCA